MNKIKILYHKRTDVSEEADFMKTKKLKTCDWYYLNKEFKFQPYICKWGHDLLMMSVNVNSIHILNIKNGDY